MKSVLIMSACQIDVKCMKLPLGDQLERRLQGVGPVVALVCKINI